MKKLASPLYLVGLSIVIAFAAALYAWPLIDKGFERLEEWRYKVATAPLAHYDHLLATVKQASVSDGPRLFGAKAAAEEVLRSRSLFGKDFEYPNAVYYSHIVLGRINVREGRLDEAEAHLISAALVPVIDARAPNVQLAEELLRRGRRDVVLQYLDTYYTHSLTGRRNMVPIWKKQIRDGRIPNWS